MIGIFLQSIYWNKNGGINMEIHNNTSPTIWNYIAGVGVGTLLTVFAQSIEDNIVIKNWLLFVAPAFTIVTTILLNWIVNSISDKMAHEKYEKRRDELILKLERDLGKNYLNREHKKKITEILFELKMKDAKKNAELIGFIDIGP